MHLSLTILPPGEKAKQDRWERKKQKGGKTGEQVQKNQKGGKKEVLCKKKMASAGGVGEV